VSLKIRFFIANLRQNKVLTHFFVVFYDWYALYEVASYSAKSNRTYAFKIMLVFFCSIISVSIRVKVLVETLFSIAFGLWIGL